MSQYRKKPIIVQAERFHQCEPLPFRDNGCVRFGCSCAQDERCHLCNQFWIDTREGPMTLTEGDWVIKGVAGEFYPCKPDIFAATYEPVEPAPQSAGASPGAPDQP